MSKFDKRYIVFDFDYDTIIIRKGYVAIIGPILGTEIYKFDKEKFEQLYEIFSREFPRVTDKKTGLLVSLKNLDKMADKILGEEEDGEDNS